jgi:hypothetical protein
MLSRYTIMSRILTSRRILLLCLLHSLGLVELQRMRYDLWKCITRPDLGATILRDPGRFDCILIDHDHRAMTDFDPFGTNKSAALEPVEMPKFGSFDFSPEPAVAETPAFPSFAANPPQPRFPAIDSFASPKRPAPEPAPASAPAPERLSVAGALACVEGLLKPLPRVSAPLDFSIDLVKVDIPPPPPFCETALGQELVDFCQREYGHTFVFAP